MAKPPRPSQAQDAIGWFSSRVPFTADEVNEMDTRASERAMYFSDVTQLRLVGEVHRAISDAVAKGTTLEEFKRAVGAKLEADWGGPRPAQLETVFRNGVQTAYSAGRLEQFEEPVMKRLRPFRAWSVILDARTTEVICRPLSKVVVPADSAFARERVPPLHHRCRTGIMSLSAAQAGEDGITEHPPHAPPAKGFGGDPRVPKQVDISGEPEALRKVFERKQAGHETPLPAPEKRTPDAARDLAKLEAAVQSRSQEAKAAAKALKPSVRALLGASLTAESSLMVNKQLEGLARVDGQVLVHMASRVSIHVGERGVDELGSKGLTGGRSGAAGSGDERATWAAVTGVLDVRSAEILVNATNARPQTLTHEMGHAVDIFAFAEGDPLASESSSPGFRRAYEGFRTSGLEFSRLPYFTGNDATGPAETFAEAFSDLAHYGFETAARRWTRPVVEHIQAVVERMGATK